MSAPVTLLMAVHSHQPAGNFGFVFEEAYAKAYDPFLRVLEGHPGVRLSLHYSGCLLDWLVEHRPEFIKRVRALVAKGQVELLASGYYEPILPLIPEADRQGQIAQMRAALKKHFGVESTGLWLTERVWEPELPATLQRAGIAYTMVDTNQFLPAQPWLPGAMQVQDDAFWDLLGSYATEYTGSSVRLFPASKRLRYWMPFQAVEQTIDFLRRIRRDEPVAITFADDGEKFGLWPKTYRWVYEEGWLDHFFGALEREREWLATSTFRDYAHTTGTQGTAYLPCGSYEEMLEWSGGSFRNFFTKYPEANAMLQKMLTVSARVAELGRRRPTPPAKLIEHARRELYTAQCNCAYWHGVFGGLYLTHLRRAIYAHLIAAEALVARAGASRSTSGPRATITLADMDGDGREEVRLQTPAMSLIADPADGGTVTEWSLYAPPINLLDTLSRRVEPYHAKLKAQQAQPVSTGQGVASIHDALGTKEEHLETYLIYDDHRRSAFLDYALQDMPTLQDVVRSTWGERRLWSSGPYEIERSSPGKGAAKDAQIAMVRVIGERRIRKTIRVAAGRPSVECRYELTGPHVPVVALEFNLSLRDDRYLTQPGERSSVAHFDVREPSSGVSLRMTMDPPATLLHFPVETVSESEGGLERTYQALCLVCLWAPATGSRVTGGPWTSRVQWTVGRA